MNISQNPELTDRLAAAYALGTLRGGARRRFEIIAREHPSVRTAALVWQSRLSSMNELQMPAEPAPAVWMRIHNLVQADIQQQAMASQKKVPVAGGWWHSLALWRTAGLTGVFTLVVATVAVLALRNELDAQSVQIEALQQQMQGAPDVRYVAVLNDEKATPSIVVTFDPRDSRMNLQRVSGFREAPDRSLQLWALPVAGAPRSLGVLAPDRQLQLPVSEPVLREAFVLAISLEPLGGVPGDTGPSGPILFKGPLIAL